MKTIVAGSRGILDYAWVENILKKHLEEITEIVCGEAKGVDTLGRRFGEEYLIPVKSFPADWDLYQRKAGWMRNKEMGDYADQLIALWDGESRGTKHMIEYMKYLKKPVTIWTKV